MALETSHRTTENLEIRLPWAVKAHSSPKEFKSYFPKILKALQDYWKDYVFDSTERLQWYLGRGHEFNRPVTRRADATTEPRRYSSPITFNHAFDLVEQRANREARFKPSFDVTPANTESDDMQNARLMQVILRNINRRNNFEMLLGRGDRMVAVMGMQYFGVEWDQGIGDYIDPEEKKKGREGDVRYCVQDPRFVFPYPTPTWEDSPFLIEIYKIVHKDIIKKKYKVDAPTIERDGLFTFEESQCVRPLGRHEVPIYRLIYKPDEFLPEGLCCLCLEDGTILEKKEKYPYSHEEFPYERLTDVDILGTQVPFASFSNLITGQKHHDKISGLQLRNLYLLSHPKVFIPMGSQVSKGSWANSPLFVKYAGGVPPTVQSFGTSHPEMDRIQDKIRLQMEQLYGIQGVSRGAPPPGTRSGVQLLFFEEQEQQRSSSSIIKRNDFIRRILTKAASEVGDHYPTSSERRLIREVGANNETILRSLETAKISGGYDVIIQNAAAFSDSKAGRIQQVLDLVQTMPDLLTKEQVADILELGQSEKAFDVATAALRKAEWENGLIREGQAPPDPTPYEDLIVHLRTHYIEVQSIGFAGLPESQKKKLFEHIELTEGLAEELSLKNQLFAQQLLTLPHFPMFYELTPAPEPPTPPANPGGAAPGLPGDAALGALGADALELPPGPQAGDIPEPPLLVAPPIPGG